MKAIALAILMLGPVKLWACSNDFYGGNLAQLRLFVEHEVARAVYAAWSEDHITINEMEEVEVEQSKIDIGSSIFYKDGKIHYTDQFVRLVTHIAIASYYRQQSPRRFTPIQVLKFHEELAASIRLGAKIEYFPQRFGAHGEACWALLRSGVPLQQHFELLRSVRMAVVHFWAFHELAHHVLDHRPPEDVLLLRERYRQEYAADAWAVSAMISISSGPFFAYSIGPVLDSLQYMNGHTAYTAMQRSLTHPPTPCRKRAIARKALEYLYIIPKDLAPSLDSGFLNLLDGRMNQIISDAEKEIRIGNTLSDELRPFEC